MINPDLAELLRYNQPEDPHAGIYARVVAEVAAIHGVTVHQMRGRERSSPLPMARREACVRLRVLGLSLPAIGRELGGMDHTSVLYHLRKRKALLESAA